MTDSEAFWSFGSEVPEHAAPAPTHAAPSWKRDERVGGRYVLEDRLGRGAHATVFRAFDSQLKRWVALKVLGSLEPEAQARLHREAQLLARLKHPALLRVHDVLFHDDRMLLVLELVKGPTLEEALDRLEPDEGLRLLERVARGLGEAHRQGVVHRDVKPSNVLLAEDGPRLADFGLARAALASSLTQTGALVGTPTYMAPEQLEGRRDVGPQADVWALGVILFRLLTGQLPFRAPNLVAQRQLVARGAPRFGALGVVVSPELEAVCARALTPDPELRFPDAAAFASALSLAREGGAWRAEPQRSHLWGPALMMAAAAVGLGLAFATRTAGPPRPAEPSPAAGSATTGRVDPAPGDLERSLALEAAGDLLRAGRYPESVAEFERILAQAPGLTEGWVQRGMALATQGNWRAAERSFGHALDLEPGHVLALEARAGVRWELGLRSLAEADRSELRRLAADRPAAAVAFVRSGRVRGLVDEALAACNGAIERGTSEAGLFVERALLRFQRGERALAWEDMARAAGLPSTEPGLAWQNMGSDLYGVGEFEAAIQALDRALARGAGYLDALTLRGFCKEQVGLSGVEDHQRALELGETRFRASFFRGRYRFDVGDAVGALSDLELAWASADGPERDDTFAWLILARAAANGAVSSGEPAGGLWLSYLRARQAGEPARSVALLLELVELLPDLAEVSFRLGQARLELEQDAPALADLNRALELEPNHRGARWSRSQALARLGRRDDAIRDLETLVRQTPNEPRVWRLLGRLVCEAGRLTEALSLADRAVEVGGEMVDYTNRCTVRVGLGDRAGGLADALRALELEQGAELQHRISLASVLASLEEWGLALGLADRILRLDERVETLLVRAFCRTELELPGADTDLDRILELQPEHGRALFLRGSIRLDQGRAAEALADLERVPDDPTLSAQLERALAEARARLAGD